MVQTREVETEETEDELGVNGNGAKEQADVILVRSLYDTVREKLPEMTNIPLDKVRPLTWILTYAKEILEICDEIIKSQKRLSVQYAKYHDGIEPDVDWLREWPSQRGKVILLMVEWVYSYCQFRRSVSGDHVKNAVLLAQDQIATQEGKEQESPFDKAMSQ